jgi:hypothetical protein
MKLQAIVSSVALAAALTFSGAAVAQQYTITVPVPEDRVQDFTDACAALMAKNNTSLTVDDDQGAVDETTTGSTGKDTQQADSPDPAAQDNWDELIAGLTMEDCKTGGFAAE